MSLLLEVKGLTTQFNSEAGVIRAVDNVSLELTSGETLGLVGESGSGKSATALSIMRLLPEPSARIIGGQIMFEGRDLATIRDAEMRHIRGKELAMIFQDPMTSLNPVISIGDQIAEAISAHTRMNSAALRERTLELLRLVNIPNPEGRLKAFPHQFSGGMRQRVMIAMAVSCNPKMIIADEPTTALDVTVQAQILDLLRRLSVEFNTATLLITHDLGVVAGLANRVSVMYAGRIIEEARTTELFSNPKMPYTWGLLRSVPRLDQPLMSRLVPIDGVPPHMSGTPSGCRFEPRCPYRREICGAQEPSLLPVRGDDQSHRAACWGTQDVPDGGWLIKSDWRRDLGDPRVIEKIRRSVAQISGSDADRPPTAAPAGN